MENDWETILVAIFPHEYVRLVRIAASVAGPDAAEDVVGDVILDILTRRPVSRSPTAYVRAAVWRRACKVARRARREVSLDALLGVQV